MNRYWWGHEAYGSQHLARCNVCGAVMAQWQQGWGTEGLPPGVRRKVDEHAGAHDSDSDGQA